MNVFEMIDETVMNHGEDTQRESFRHPHTTHGTSALVSQVEGRIKGSEAQNDQLHILRMRCKAILVEATFSIPNTVLF